MSTKATLLHFTKMHGAGNDFIMLDGVRQSIALTPSIVRALAHRQMGIGADQILLVEPSSVADFRYRIFNADGSEVEHCGNGARCFVRFIHEQGLSTKNPIRAEIATGVISLLDTEEGAFVEMGSVKFTPHAVPFDTQALATRQVGNLQEWELPGTSNTSYWLSVAAISNPHAVMEVADVASAPVADVGKYIESHTRFAHQVNVGFMQIQDTHTILLRVYERGAGETLACGTGACAAVAIGIEQGKLVSPVQVRMAGGTLTVEWENQQLRMSGPVATVFSGSVDYQQLHSTTGIL